MGCMEMCGALSGAFMLAGMKNSAGADQPGMTKGQTYKVTKMLKEKFEQKNGAYLCRDLKGVATAMYGAPVRAALRMRVS